MTSKIWATGRSGTIGRFLPEFVHDLKIRIDGRGQFGGNFPNLEEATLIHLAARVGHIGGLSEEIAWKINVTGSVNLAKLAIAERAAAFIFVSSSHVYGFQNFGHIETEKLAPISFYGRQKAEAEKELIRLFTKTKTQTRLIILRVFSVLDFGMNPNTLGGRIERAITRGSSEVVPTSLDKRDFLTPRTVAQALAEIAQLNSAEGVYNICSGVLYSLSEATLRMVRYSRNARIPLFIEENSSVPVILGDRTKLDELGLKTHLAWDLLPKP